jgi:hypothetical protein
MATRAKTVDDKTVEKVNTVYELLERIQKDEKEIREKVGRDDKVLKNDDLRLLAAATKAVRGMKKKKIEMLEEIAKAFPEDDKS